MMTKYTFLIAVVAVFGCAANPTPICIPEVITREVLVPVTLWNNAESLPELHLPAYPPHPGAVATNDDKKKWAVAVAAAALRREAIMKARIEALNIQLDVTRPPSQ